MCETSQEETQDSQNLDINDDSLDAILSDPRTKARLLQKMGQRTEATEPHPERA